MPHCNLERELNPSDELRAPDLRAAAPTLFGSELPALSLPCMLLFFRATALVERTQSQN